MNIKDYQIFQKAGTFLEEIARSEIIIQALFVGIISGVLVVLFKVCITDLFNFIQGLIKNLTIYERLIIFPLITTLGGLISGLLVFKIAPETRGSGIPYVKLTLARIGKGTRIRSILVKFFAGIVGIGTGLSLGREGPSVQLGAGAGALVAKIFKMTGTDQDKLVASGAGAAIGATFNAPIAGAIFVLEELVQNFSSSLLFPVLVATVSAAAIARHFLGSNPSFQIPTILTPISFITIPVFIVLGIVAGIFGVLFAKNIFLSISIYDRFYKVPIWCKPAIAGFIVGLIGVFLPYILSAGNNSVDLLLQSKFTVGFILLIFIGKFFITPLCFGSGAAGGIFLPILMLGSFLGYLLGIASNSLGIHVDPVVIALVGMGAFLSAVARAPITSVVMVFEMTGDYNHILPIMLSAAIADLIAEKLNHAPIYSTLIFKQGSKTKETKFLSNIKVKNAMTKNVQKFMYNMSIESSLELMNMTTHSAYPVISNEKKLIGIITRADIENAFLQGNSPDAFIEKIMDPHPLTIKPDDDLYKTSYLLHSNNTAWLIVTDRTKNIKGIITRFDLNKILNNFENSVNESI
ncbi:MAG: chloride channel protein [Candidatus Gastranaerophilales bacterium]|nr:chloride channel protein [Candidatus Gastranaerophilales bacterium]